MMAGRETNSHWDSVESIKVSSEVMLVVDPELENLGSIDVDHHEFLRCYSKVSSDPRLPLESCPSIDILKSLPVNI
jgi:hypothetical protein